MVYDRDMSKARLHLIYSITFLLSSIALWNLVSPVPVPTPAERPAVVEQQAPSIFAVEGVWEQYYVEGEQRQFMARLNIQKSENNYVAVPLSLAPDAFPKHAYLSYDHHFENGRWTFKEAWSCHSTGQFELVEQPNGEYLGWAYSEQDGHGFQTVFVRVQ